MQCRHFFVTWSGDFPRGCRAYGFRSPDYPSVIVLRESGISCQLFEVRPPGASPESESTAAGRSFSKGRLVH